MCLPIAPATFVAPPIANGVDGKARYVVAVAYADIAAVGADIIDAIRHRLIGRVLRPVVHQLWLGGFAPRLARILEIAEQLVFSRPH